MLFLQVWLYMLKPLWQAKESESSFFCPPPCQWTCMYHVRSSKYVWMSSMLSFCLLFFMSSHQRGCHPLLFLSFSSLVQAHFPLHCCHGPLSLSLPEQLLLEINSKRDPTPSSRPPPVSLRPGTSSSWKVCLALRLGCAVWSRNLPVSCHFLSISSVMFLFSAFTVVLSSSCSNNWRLFLFISLGSTAGRDAFTSCEE